MSIIVKDLLPEDITGSLGDFTSLINKINFNFDQILINGGGPIGLPGNIGPQGIPGPVGKRGNLWFSGNTGPTQSYDGGILITGDQYVNSDGDLISYYAGSTGWTSSGINIKGPKGETGANGLNGSIAGFNIYKGGTADPYGITLSDGDIIRPTGATGEDINYVNFPAIENRANSFFIGDISWASSFLKNFGVTYDDNLPDWIGFSQLGHSQPKTIFIQDRVDNISNMLMSFGAYGLTNTNSSTYGWGYGGETANTDFIDFVNFGFTNETIYSNNKTKFKIYSRKIPIYIKAGGDDINKGETAADIILTANSVKINAYGSTGLNVNGNVYLNNSISSQLNIANDNFISVGYGSKPSTSNYFINVSNAGNTAKGGVIITNSPSSINKIGLSVKDLSTTTGSTAIHAYSLNGVALHIQNAGSTGIRVDDAAGITDLYELNVRNSSKLKNTSVNGIFTVSSGSSLFTLNLSDGATFNSFVRVNGLSTFIGGLTATGATISGDLQVNGDITSNRLNAISGLQSSGVSYLDGGLVTTGATINIINNTPSFIAGLTANSAFFTNGLTSSHANINTVKGITGATVINGYAPAIKAFGSFKPNELNPVLEERSFNIGSVQFNDNEGWQINFETHMPTSNYIVVVSLNPTDMSPGGFNSSTVVYVISKATDNFIIRCVATSISDYTYEFDGYISFIVTDI